MALKRRTTKAAARSVEVAARDAVVTSPAPTRFARLIARLGTLKGAIVAIAGMGAVLGGLAGYWNAYEAARASTQSSSLLALVGKGNAGPLSIVVLPFANLTGDPQQGYLADGLTAAVTADLSRIRDAFVVSTATAFAYKDKSVTAQQIGKELGVRFALQGGVQRSGDKVRINAQLADTTSNAQLWSESFDGSQADLFALQDRVTIRIGNSIGREMVIVAARDSETRKGDPKVADLMVRARALGLKPISLRTYEERQALYRQALLLEPSNVQAMVGLAGALAFVVDNGLMTDPLVSEKQLVEGRDLALKARELDSNIPNIYSVLGVYAYRHGDLEGARRDFETALSLEPKEPMRYNAVAWGYLKAGDPVRAIELLTQGIRLDPRNLREHILDNMGRAQFMKGDDEAAIEWLLKAVDANPAWAPPKAYLAMAYARKGDRARARAAAVALLRADPSYSLSKSEAPWPGQPAAFREWWETKLLPAWRLAGLPE